MTTLWIGLYLFACPLCWYLISAFNYAMNGGQLGRHPYLFPLQCFAEDIKCYWFGGKKYRISFIKERCNGNGYMLGRKKTYEHEEIRKNNLYEEVFWQMREGRISFWLGNLFILFLGPALVIFIIAQGLLTLIINLALWPINRLFGTNFELD